MAHLFVCVCVCVWIVSVLSVSDGTVFLVLLGKSYRMLWMVSSSCWYLSASKLYIFNLLYRNLTAAHLCCD